VNLSITEEMFEEWMTTPVTLKLFKLLKAEREDMKEGLVNDAYEHPELVKGRCQALGLLLDLEYVDLQEKGTLNVTEQS
tara:strand:- start:4066 stop:4302 length:237 start_codon:yes stop_codon:yes gene_type:complete